MAKFKANNNKKKKKIFVSPKQITVVPAGAKLEELEIPKTRLTRAGEPTPKFFKNGLYILIANEQERYSGD